MGKRAGWRVQYQRKLKIAIDEIIKSEESAQLLSDLAKIIASISNGKLVPRRGNIQSPTKDSPSPTNPIAPDPTLPNKPRITSIVRIPIDLPVPKFWFTPSSKVESNSKITES